MEEAVVSEMYPLILGLDVIAKNTNNDATQTRIWCFWMQKHGKYWEWRRNFLADL